MRSLTTVNVYCIGAVLLTLVLVSSGCFIRNCPPGGKRSMEQMRDVQSVRQCMSCGPREQGQCVGPNICCGPDIGCHINTAVSKACNEENNILTPCEIRGAICGENGSRCVADGICCNSETCTLDSTCEATTRTSKRSRVSSGLVQFIKRLIDESRFPQHMEEKR